MIEVKKSTTVGALQHIQDIPGKVIHGWPLSEGGYCVVYVEEHLVCPQCAGEHEHKMDCSLAP